MTGNEIINNFNIITEKHQEKKREAENGNCSHLF